MYCDFHTFLIDSLEGLEIDAIIYLRSSPEVSLLPARTAEEPQTIGFAYHCGPARP